MFACIYIVGPGSYNKTGIGQDSMKKAYIESTRRGVFGTTSARINPMVKRDDYYLPGPAHYTVKEAAKVGEVNKQHQPMGVFSSLSHRVHDDVEAKVRQLLNLHIELLHILSYYQHNVHVTGQL